MGHATSDVPALFPLLHPGNRIHSRHHVQHFYRFVSSSFQIISQPLLWNFQFLRPRFGNVDYGFHPSNSGVAAGRTGQVSGLDLHTVA